MAFPVPTRTTGTTGAGSNVTAHVVDLPAVGAGDLLIVAFGMDTNGSRTMTPPADWTEILDDDGGAVDNWAIAAYRIFASGQGATTVTFTSSAVERGAYHVFHYAAGSWHGTTPPEASVVAIATSTAPDSPSLTASWGADDNQWISFAVREGNAAAPSAYPTNYGNGANTAEGTVGGASLASAWRDLNAATENPGAYTTPASTEWVAFTIVVRGAASGGDVAKAGSDTGAGTDTGSLAASDTATDTGAGADSVEAAVPINETDTGTGADTVTAATEPAPGTDSGTAIEDAVIAAEVPAADTGSGVDTGFLSYAEQLTAELGAGAEQAILSMLVDDVGLAVDSVTLAILAPAHWSILIEDETGAMIERRSWVKPFPGLRVENRSIGGAGTATIPIYDRARTLNLTTERRVQIIHRDVEAFEGFVRVRRRADMGYSDGPILYVLECQDFTPLLYDDVIETAYRSTAESDKARVAWLVSTFGTKGITAGAEVQQLLATMPPGEDGRPEQDFSAKTLGAAIEQVARLSGAQFYVDSTKRLHYFATESAAAPFNVSDAPNGTTTRPFGSLILEDDSLDLRHRVLVVGTGVKVWRQLGSLPAAEKIRSAVIRDDRITSVAEAEAAGDAFLDTYGVSEVAGSLTCFEAGLRAGQTIEITHTGFGLVAAPYPIASVNMHPIAAEAAQFDVQFGRGALDLGDVVGATRQTIDVVGQQAAAAATGLRELQAAGANLLPDSSFEASVATAWAIGTGWTHGYASAAAFRGSKTARLSRSNQAAGVLRQAAYTPISRIDDYQVSAWSLLSALGANVQAELYLEEYNAASTLLTTTVLWTGLTTEAEWTRHAARFGPTAGVGVYGWQPTTTKVKVGLRAAGSDTTPTITWEIDGVQLERGKLLTAFAPAPEELSNVPGEVIIDDSGITIVNGALVVKNPGSTVIIDGTSDMHKIVATGTLATGANSGTSEVSASASLSTGLTYRPVNHWFLDLSAGAQHLPYYFNNWAVTANAGADTLDGYNGRANVVNTNQTQVTAYLATTRSAGLSSRTFRYYVYKEVAI